MTSADINSNSSSSFLLHQDDTVAAMSSTSHVLNHRSIQRSLTQLSEPHSRGSNSSLNGLHANSRASMASDLTITSAFRTTKIPVFSSRNSFLPSASSLLSYQQDSNTQEESHQIRWEGMVRKKGDWLPRWDERYFVLHNTTLTYYNLKQDARLQRHKKGQFNISNVMSEYHGKVHGFVIETKQRKQYHICCFTELEKDIWIDMIQSAIHNSPQRNSNDCNEISDSTTGIFSSTKDYRHRNNSDIFFDTKPKSVQDLTTSTNTATSTAQFPLKSASDDDNSDDVMHSENLFEINRMRRNTSTNSSRVYLNEPMTATSAVSSNSSSTRTTTSVQTLSGSSGKVDLRNFYDIYRKILTSHAASPFFFNKLSTDIVLTSNYLPTIPFWGTYHGFEGIVHYLSLIYSHVTISGFFVTDIAHPANSDIAVISGRETITNRLNGRKFTQQWEHTVQYNSAGLIQKITIFADHVAACTVFGSFATSNLSLPKLRTNALYNTSSTSLIQAIQNMHKIIPAGILHVHIIQGLTLDTGRLSDIESELDNEYTLKSFVGIRMCNDTKTNVYAPPSSDDCIVKTLVVANNDPVWDAVTKIRLQESTQGKPCFVLIEAWRSETFYDGTSVEELIGVAKVNIAPFVTLAYENQNNKSVYSTQYNNNNEVNGNGLNIPQWYTLLSAGEMKYSCGQIQLNIGFEPLEVLSDTVPKNVSEAMDLPAAMLESITDKSLSALDTITVDLNRESSDRNSSLCSSYTSEFGGGGGFGLLSGTSKYSNKACSQSSGTQNKSFLTTPTKSLHQEVNRALVSRFSISPTASASGRSSLINNSSVRLSSYSFQGSKHQNQKYYDYQRDTHQFRIGKIHFDIPKRYQLIKAIGQGAYGCVIAASDVDTGQTVAVKNIPNAFHDLIDAKRIVREIRLMQHLKHPNLVNLLDVLRPISLTDFRDIYIVTDLMETDLHRVIHSNQTLSDEHIQYITYQMLVGLQYVHSANVIHRDLKPSNILINSSCELKICDFGLARGVFNTNLNTNDPKPSYPQDASATTVNNNTVNSSNYGQLNPHLTEYVVTRWYRAPELLLSSQYNTGIDVWSIGCIVAELLGRRPLFPGNDYMHQLKLILEVVGTPKDKHDLRFITNSKAKRFICKQRNQPGIDFSELYPRANAQCLDLLKELLIFNPHNRITVEKALEHPYFANIRDKNFEIKCSRPFDFSFEMNSVQYVNTNGSHSHRSKEFSKKELQQLVFEDVVYFHPDILYDNAANSNGKDEFETFSHAIHRRSFKKEHDSIDSIQTSANNNTMKAKKGIELYSSEQSKEYPLLSTGTVLESKSSNGMQNAATIA